MNELKGVSIGSSFPRLLIYLKIIVFIFPVLVATSGLGTYLLFLMVIPALVYGRGWAALDDWEKRLLLGFVIAFLVLTLSLINAEDLREGLKWLDRYMRMALMVPLYLLFRRMGFTLGRELALGAVVAGFVMLAQAIYQIEWQRLPIASGYYHKIVFGDLAVLWGAVGVVYALVLVKRPLAQVGIALSVLAVLYVSLLSQTRGAWLFVPVFMVLLLWAQWGRGVISRRWLFIGMAMLLAAGGVGTQSELLKRGIVNGIHDLEVFARNPATGNSWGTRINLWRNSLIIVKDNPLLGTGLGDFRHDMQRLVKDGRSWSKHVVVYDHAHSIYFDTLAKGGILGFLAMVIAYLILPFMAFKRGLRMAVDPTQRFYALGGMVLVTAFATFGLTEGLWARNPFVNTYVICLVVLLAGMVNSREQAESDMDQRLS